MARVSLSDLLTEGLLNAGEVITLTHKGETREATILGDGKVSLPDGSVFTSLSTAAGAVTGRSTNGWAAWRVVRLGKSMADVRAAASTA